MPAWNDKQIERFMYRESLFKRRGMSPVAAEALAERLVYRDFERDDRRACAECESLQRSGTCFQAAQGRIRGATKVLTPITHLLQRCDFFSFQKP